MALLEAVVLAQDHRPRLPCGTPACVLCGYGDVGELEGVKMSVMVRDGEDVVADATPLARRSACWPADVVGAATTWASPVQTTTTTLAPSTARRRPVQHAAAVRKPRRRRRTNVPKDDITKVEHAETQRLNHIVVERNRRRQMNQHLATLRTLMPRSYARRGDQASIVGGAINFVKELEHRLQSLHAEKHRYAAASSSDHAEAFFTRFFTLPQYSVSAALADDDGGSGSTTTRPGVADVEAAVSSDGYATVKMLAPRRRSGQQQQQLLLRLLLGMQLRGLTALHLNVTTAPAGQMVFYTITSRMGDGCQLSSAGDVAAAVHDIVAEAANTGEEELAWHVVATK